MASQSRNVVDLAEFKASRLVETTQTTAGEMRPEGGERAQWRVTNDEALLSTGNKLLPASKLYGVDDSSEITAFLIAASKAIELISDIDNQLACGDFFGADDRMMNCTHFLSTAFLHASFSDSASVILLKALQAGRVFDVSEMAELPRTINHALRAITARPFMDFGQACEFADNIESACQQTLVLPNFGDIAEALIEGTKIKVNE